VASDPSPASLAKKTIQYAEAKMAYCQALRTAMPELIDIATGRQARPLSLEILPRRSRWQVKCRNMWRTLRR
jgi:hypothetical protein